MICDSLAAYVTRARKRPQRPLRRERNGGSRGFDHGEVSRQVGSFKVSRRKSAVSLIWSGSDASAIP